MEKRTPPVVRHVVYVFTVFGRVGEAARVVQPWRLLEGGGEGRGGQRRSRGFSDCESCGRGDGGVDIVPYDFIGLVVEDHSEERYDMLNVEVIGVDR